MRIIDLLKLETERDLCPKVRNRKFQISRRPDICQKAKRFSVGMDESTHANCIGWKISNLIEKYDALLFNYQ